MASIQKRVGKDGTVTYRVQVRLKGAKPQTATFKRLTDAKRWAQSIEAAIREGRHFKAAEAKRHTLAELVDRYKRDVIPHKKPQQQKDYTRQLEWWKARYGHLALAEFTAATITEGRDELLAGGRSPATVNRYLAALSHALSVAAREWEWIEDNPCLKVRKCKEPPGRVRYLSADERKRLLEACRASSNPLLYPVVLLALSTGMRQGEIMNLRWADVNLQGGWLVLHETKNGERRRVPLVGPALEALREHARVRRLDTPYVFPGKTGKPAELRAAWLRALREAGIEDFRFHDLRHTTASYLAMSGATPGEIAEILGHRTLQMVRRYAHLSESHTRSVLERAMSKVLG